MSPGIYDHALLCDIAFDFRDIRREVDGIEACIKAHLGIPVRTVLDVGCGTSPYIAGLAGRGYLLLLGQRDSSHKAQSPIET